MRNEYHMLLEIEKSLLAKIDTTHHREVVDSIDRTESVVGMTGERGVGKTTILLQQRKKYEDAFYFSANQDVVTSHWLFAFVHYVQKEFGIKRVYIDEIFGIADRSRELQNIIDSLPDLQVVFSGSSSIALHNNTANLFRRIYHIKIWPLTFSEFLALHHDILLPRYTLDEILHDATHITARHIWDVSEQLWLEYQQQWCYPYSIWSSHASFVSKLSNTLKQIITHDLPNITSFQTVSLQKLSNLFYFIAHSEPSDLNILSLSKKIWLDKNLVDNALHYLWEIGVLHITHKHGTLSDKIRKQVKILFGNPNLYHLYHPHPNMWSVRESIFLSHIKRLDIVDIAVPSQWDYTVLHAGKELYFEIWWPNKWSKQIVWKEHGYVVRDDMHWSSHSIPLWLFGLLHA